ncbi:hypothetical protein [Lentibacillus saliphilus]|uniref:hypothetical protein n=1 Tax=Lentibacillus saliphilus TaxID=2737028 RepID=UPI001C30CEB8|nr:hypothetical protein [Lentibacillus saliphilus]
MMVLFLLTGCGKMVLELDKDGSGEVEIEVAANGIISKKTIENEMKKQFDGKEGVEGLKIKESGDKIDVRFKFENVSKLDSSAYLIPVSDYAVAKDSRLDALATIDEDVKLDEDSSSIFVKLPSDLNDFTQSKVVLPGNVVAYSQGVEVIEDDTIELSSAQGDVYVVYEPQTGLAALAWGLVLIPVGGGAYYYVRKKKSETTPHIGEEGDVDA